MSVPAAQSSVQPPVEPTRVVVEVDERALYVARADGGWDEVGLHGARAFARDAAWASRFVRHAIVRTPQRRLDLITPPEEGAIAPRAARLPGVPRASFIVAGAVWDTVVGWIRGGGRLGGRTIVELARLACVATPTFAIAIGECVAHVAAELTWERLGPMRGGGSFVQMLQPLEEAAAGSPRAAEALVAAMARGAALEPYAFV